MGTAYTETTGFVASRNNLIGLTLGAVWSPCIGPTLGTAVALAMRGKGLVQTGIIFRIVLPGRSGAIHPI